MLMGAAGLLLALAGPSFAATQTHRGFDAFASTNTDRSGPYYYGPRDAEGRPVAVPSRSESTEYRATPGENYPYPDRPYGDPDRD